MGWLIGITICTVAVLFILAGRMYLLKKDVYEFADKMETSLDRIIFGKELVNEEETEDTLWGKSCEKLVRVHHIWTEKEKENIRKKEQMKELISDISRQTKTPIANIKLYLEFLQEENLSDRGLDFLKNLQGQTEKLEFLLQSMVKMSRLEAGSILIKSREENLYKTLARAVEEIVPPAAKKGIRISVDCEEKMFLKHDSKWTEEAVFNVLDNAVKYTGPKGTIHISVIRQEMFTKIAIKDSGKGILLERQAQIFTRFYREPEVHSENGIGIGLYLTREIMEMQNGYIEVHSEPGQGSEFCLYLPNE